LTRTRIAALVLFDLAAILIVAGLVSLAVWQTHRRAWKLDLIARIEARVHAAPTAAPGPERWPGITAATTSTGASPRPAAGSPIALRWSTPSPNSAVATGS
jgi:hypothetical protein